MTEKDNLMNIEEHRVRDLELENIMMRQALQGIEKIASTVTARLNVNISGDIYPLNGILSAALGATKDLSIEFRQAQIEKAVRNHIKYHYTADNKLVAREIPVDEQLEMITESELLLSERRQKLMEARDTVVDSLKSA